MSDQLKSLNQNIEGKNRKIKSTYRSMKRVRVYFLVQTYTLDMSDMVYESPECTIAKATKIFKVLTHTEAERAKLLSIRPAKYIHQLVRIQTGGYVGGIILGGSRQVIETYTI